MFFVGDVHGKFSKYRSIIDKLPGSIQLGDMGLGFGRDDKFPIVDGNYFIRGNHDSPIVCRQQQNYLGEYGSLDPGYFFVSGGDSIDKARRIIGVSWWQEEELNTTQMNQAFIGYIKKKPDVMFSHECPGEVLEVVLGKRKSPEFPGPRSMQNIHVRKSSTAKALDAMFNEHQPKMWIFAHHHKNMEFDYRGTHFVCCDECCVYDSDAGKFVDVLSG